MIEQMEFFQWPSVHIQVKRLAEERAGVKSQLPLAALESTITRNQ